MAQNLFLNSNQTAEAQSRLYESRTLQTLASEKHDHILFDYALNNKGKNTKQKSTNNNEQH